LAFLPNAPGSFPPCPASFTTVLNLGGFLGPYIIGKYRTKRKLKNYNGLILFCPTIFYLFHSGKFSKVRPKLKIWETY